jgi:recombination protein U
MAWKSRGLRGSFLEEVINMTNDYYKDKGIAIVQKIPTPITPVEIDQSTRHITLAYFDKKSTVDYIGLAQGYPICFDCKECAVDTFSLQNVHAHQVDFMEKFKAQGGIAFLLIYYTQKELVYYMKFDEVKSFYERAVNGGRKSVRFEELNPKYLYEVHQAARINYLDFVNDELEENDSSID